MSRIDELIAEHCPDGVEYWALGEVAELVRGNGMPKTSLTAGGVGAIHYGQIYTHYGSWTNETLSFVAPETALRLAKVEPGDVIVTNTSENLEDVGKAVAWLGEASIVTGGHATVIKHSMDPKYLSYWFQSPHFFAQKRKLATGTKVIDVSASKLGTVQVPVPPLEVQQEIVRILDQFTELEAELEAELAARRKQYDHYRRELLDFTSEVELFPLAELGQILTGRTPKATLVEAWGDDVDFVTPTDIKTDIKHIRRAERRLSYVGASAMARVVIPGGSLLVTCIGADMGKTVVTGSPCVPNQQINALVPNGRVSVDYLYHVMASKRQWLLEQGSRASGTIPILNKTNFSRIKVPVPPLAQQRHIAAILDEFDALVTDISVGLPAELSARRKQYEYYRDKLLTFKERL